MLFRPNQSPRAVLPGELSTDFVRSIVICNPILKIVGVPDVEISGWVLKDVHTEHKQWLQG